MPGKKTTRAKKVPGGKKRIGLTSAIGPKATTMVVIMVMAGGIMVAARQQQTRAKEALIDAARADVVLTPEPAASGKKSAATSRAASNATSDATSSVPAATADGTAAKTPSMTVTGCLERTDEGFRMKDTAGADAPKARSWKSGFLKKGSASVDLVNPPKKLRLSDHVGERVSLTGVMVDRDMQVRSLHRVAPSCN